MINKFYNYTCVHATHPIICRLKTILFLLVCRQYVWMVLTEKQPKVHISWNAKSPLLITWTYYIHLISLVTVTNCFSDAYVACLMPFCAGAKIKYLDLHDRNICHVFVMFSTRYVFNKLHLNFALMTAK